MTSEIAARPTSKAQQEEVAERLAWLKALIASGAYNVDAEKIAEAMLAEHRPYRSFGND